MKVVGRRKDWAAFLETMMIDRRVLERSPDPYSTSATALLKGLHEMDHFDAASLRAAAASGRAVRSAEGLVIKVAELPPRLANEFWE